MAAILDTGTERFSNSESQRYPDASYQVTAQSDLLFGRCGWKNFKMAAILDIGTEWFKQFWITITPQYLPSCLGSIRLTFGSRCDLILKMAAMVAILDIRMEPF